MSTDMGISYLKKIDPIKTAHSVGWMKGAALSGSSTICPSLDWIGGRVRDGFVFNRKLSIVVHS